MVASFQKLTLTLWSQSRMNSCLLLDDLLYVFDYLGYSRCILYFNYTRNICLYCHWFLPTSRQVFSDGTFPRHSHGLPSFESRLYTFPLLLFKRTEQQIMQLWTLHTLASYLLDLIDYRYQSYVKYRKHIVESREGFGYLRHFRFRIIDCAVKRRICNFRVREAD